MANKLIWGSDLYKGFKLDSNALLGGNIDDLLPFQMLSLEEKTNDWVRAVADYYEMAGWLNVERRAGRIQKNYWMRYGKLNQSDYIINPDINEYSQAIGMIVPQESQSPLEQFYPLVPNFIDVLRGEFIKRENQWTVQAVDQYSIDEAFKYKQEEFTKIVQEFALVEKERALATMGFSQEKDPEAYQQELEKAMAKFQELEMSSRSYRTTGVKWAEKVLRIQERRFDLFEIEPDAFESMLITDSEFWHLDLLDDDFKLELLNPKFCDYHKGPNVKYVSDGDYFLWFDFMSSGDIVNRYGRRMKEEDLVKLKEIYVKTANIIVPDYLKSHQGSYYDTSKNWLDATDMNPVMNDALLGKELAYNFMRTPNFDHNQEVDLLNPVWGRRVTGQPQMFRVMRLYWRAMKRIGWLTKVNRDGSYEESQWIDENFKVTIEPKYDTSVNKKKTKDNLIYGEHVDWTWVPEWRHVIKISPNQKHTFWMNSQNTLHSIYIDGDPVQFQFKGRNNPFDSLPPVEGCTFSHINTSTHSLVDRLRPFQILYNIAMNRVPKKILKDYGTKIAIDRRIMSTNNLSNSTNTVDPMEAYDEKLRESDIFDYTLSREALDGVGQPALPQVLNLTTVQESQFYLQLSQMLKMEAGEVIGITRNRLGQVKPSETAYGIQQGIQLSETQTEKYFEQHSNLMQRVRQRMLDAAQYYTTFVEKSRDIYMNDKDQNVFLEIEGMENLLPHYNIFLQTRANVRGALQMISQFLLGENTLPIKPSAKIEAIVQTSIPAIIDLVKKGEIEQIEREERQRAHEQEMADKQAQSNEKMQQEKLAYEAEQAELDRQKDLEVATIRSLGGIQSDNNQNNVVDANENLNAYFKQKELDNKSKLISDQNNIKRQSEVNKMVIEKEKMNTELEKEKIKGDFALKVAKENKTNAEINKNKK
jgi:hypothetical protein